MNFYRLIRHKAKKTFIGFLVLLPFLVFAADLPDLLRDKFETEVDRNNIFFSICIPGSSSNIKLKDIVQQNNDLSHQVKFWQELYLKAIDPK